MTGEEGSNAYSVVSIALSLVATDMMGSYLQAHGVNARVKDVVSSAVGSLSARWFSDRGPSGPESRSQWTAQGTPKS